MIDAHRSGPMNVTGASEIAERFDAFFIDQFGVIHDGDAPYPGAIDALMQLVRSGKPVVLLSNSGKRSAANEARLRRLGFPAASWTRFISSGEVAWGILAHDAGMASRRCLLIARDGDRSAIDGLQIDVVEHGADCDMVLIAASEGDLWPLEYYSALLKPAAERGVPAYCTNPDKQMLTPLGLRFGAGRIASLYEELGGRVIWIGKPFPAIYEAARAVIGEVDPSRILCVGDSVEHDVAGAQGAGLRSWLIAGGIHSGLGDAGFAKLFAETGATPNYISQNFRW